ncbi:MAG: hypothetical protein V1933_07570 [Candidatus Omnitrophota bacterium]
MEKDLLKHLERLNSTGHVKADQEKSSPELISVFKIRKGDNRSCPNKCGCSTSSGKGEVDEGSGFAGNCGSSCGCSSKTGAGCNGSQGHHVGDGGNPNQIK